MHVVIAGGGSAGHVSPALALAAALRRADPEIGLTFLGTEEGLEARLVPEAGYDIEMIPRVPLPRQPTPQLLTVPGRLAGAVRAVRQVLDQVRADVVVGMGGYVAMPAYVAARRTGTPVVVHEQNARPGIANRFAARFVTDHVVLSFPETPLRHGKHIGLPLRREVTSIDRAGLRAEARKAFGLDQDRPTLFVTGGSQGAVSLNTAVSGAAAALAEAGIQVLHAYGPRNKLTLVRPESTSNGEPAPPYVAVPYIDRMDFALAAGDLAVSRAGASTVSEQAAVGLPAIYVPYPVGNGEQRWNAAPVVDAGGGLLVDDAELTPDWVSRHVVDLLGDTERLNAMSAAARAIMPADADAQVAALVRDVAAKGGTR